uniref:Uncharacterized protein n=1 Tax=Lepeophtheirus salmonis TaxID=72036 RepID=A0A0K2UVT4_LEPSM
MGALLHQQLTRVNLTLCYMMSEPLKCFKHILDHLFCFQSWRRL